MRITSFLLNVNWTCVPESVQQRQLSFYFEPDYTASRNKHKYVLCFLEFALRQRLAKLWQLPPIITQWIATVGSSTNKKFNSVIKDMFFSIHKCGQLKHSTYLAHESTLDTWEYIVNKSTCINSQKMVRKC